MDNYKNENLYYIVKNITKNKYFINKQFQDDYKYSKDIISINDKEYPKLKSIFQCLRKL
ncbi:MAG: hypothetical protein ACLUG4_08485 [Bacilli bacterium]